MVKPAPVIVAALIVTGAVPVDFIVTECVTGSFTATLPKVTLVALMLSVEIAAFNSRAKLVVRFPALALSFTAWVLETGNTFAVNWAVVALAFTVTVAGADTAALLLDKLTLKPPTGAAPLIVTVQAFVPDPVMEALLQETALSCTGLWASATPVPLRLMSVALVEASLVMVIWLVAGPTAAGSKLKFKLYVPPAATETGRLVCPVMEKDCPVKLTWEIFTGTELLFTRETEALTVVPTVTFPRLTEFADAARVCRSDRFTTSAIQPDRARHRTEESNSSIRGEWKLKRMDLARYSRRSPGREAAIKAMKLQCANL
jgi:hypothetical protein